MRAIYPALRTYLQGFLGIFIGLWTASGIGVGDNLAGIDDLATLGKLALAAAIAAVPAVLSFLQNALENKTGAALLIPRAASLATTVSPVFPEGQVGVPVDAEPVLVEPEPDLNETSTPVVVEKVTDTNADLTPLVTDPVDPYDEPAEVQVNKARDVGPNP